MAYIVPVAILLGRGNYSHLARRSGVSPYTISDFLRGKRDTTFSTACKIADAAGVTLLTLRKFRAQAAGKTIPRREDPWSQTNRREMKALAKQERQNALLAQHERALREIEDEGGEA